MATSTQQMAAKVHGTTGIPWYLWCGALAVTSVTLGAHWDVSWHRSIGRDTFWTPAHIAIYLCGVLAGIACGYLIFTTTFGRREKLRAAAVHVMGFSGPLGAFLAAWGGVAMITSAPFDNWWHSAYGLDVKIISPPHTLLVLGIFAVEIGTLFLIMSAMNRAQGEGALHPVGVDQSVKTFGHLQMLLLYLAGLMLVLTMFFRIEYTLDIFQHRASAYISVALGVPLYYSTVWKAARHRWACTWMAAIYTAVLCAFILILPLFHAEPKLGPVYQPVTHFVPPPFPMLLIVPAVLLDLLWHRIGEGNRLWTALLSGPLFVLALVAVQWPFADFLMTPAAHNAFFAAGYLDYGTPSWAASARRIFLAPEHGLVLWAGLGEAMIYSSISVWLGLLLGDWMRKIKR